ncbi:MAG: excinuclease ABC subunit UvrC [Myxococcales bacterium]|nr:excinuclease ABC subunit UvrC [Myxococcales bacterium]
MSSDALDALDPALREILDRIPQGPGVYLMKDRKGRIIYIGKAQSLKNRVRSYFTRSGDTRAFVALLGRLLGDIETVVTNNEKEALLLENNLIKQHQPRFNVNLRDDKNYLVLRLAVSHGAPRAARVMEGRNPAARYPRLEVVRRIGSDGARYFGPYHSATSCRQTLQVVNRHFKLRTCTDQVLANRKRPCLQYQIKRCDAPCVFPVEPAAYAEQVRDVALFLEGKDQELTLRLRERMKEAAGRLEFEAAASVRDQLRSLERTLEEQRVVSEDQRDQDVIGYHRDGTAVEIAVLHIRGGKLLGRRTFSFSGQEFPDEEILSSFVSLYYDLGSFVPDEVLLPLEIEDRAVKEEWLRERRGQAPATGRGGSQSKVEVLVPKRGPRAQLVTLATRNAESSYVSRRDRTRDVAEGLGKLRARLGLKRDPKRIECFDISHIQGSSTVASMVVFLDGEPAKSEYRHFKVKSATNDDFASMYEVLSRRFRRSQKEEGARWPLPDLLVIDGGKGQLATALAALGDVGIDTGTDGIDVVGLAKEREDQSGATEPDRVFLPRVKDPIRLRAHTAELFVLARIRDEAHRFAVTFHKSLRRRRTLRSALEDVPGVGPKRQRELLRRFGSLKKVREATVDELAAAPGMSRVAAEAVHRFLDERSAPASVVVDSPPTPEGEEVAEDAAAQELADLAGPGDLDGGENETTDGA